ncbi:MAG: YifB family Mg chelatase-like AAA ATPase [Candidatus Velthaea sp.]
MLSLAFSSAMLGIDGYVVRIETDSSPGVPAFAIIGLPDRALSESRERVRAAIINSGFGFPPGRLLVNLAPADIRKEGPGFDLPIALALLATDEQLEPAALRESIALGELALDGTVRAVPGILPMMIAAKNAGFRKVIVPEANIAEAALVGELEIYAVPTLADAVAVVLGHGAKFRQFARAVPAEREASTYVGDFGDVRGQAIAKRALEIAAAGGHNAVLVGPPGCGKTMLARRVPSILPSMPDSEALEVTKVYSVAGLLGANPRIVRTRPFRAPHHTISQIALVGGGSHPKPGEISLAQHGVLYLDELGEFSRSALEVMRQPLEEGSITLSRAAGTFTYPARFMLIASMNPCPCGYRGSRGNDCRCDDAMVQKYVSKLSGPLLDRIDLHVTVTRVSFEDITGTEISESSEAIRNRVEAARTRQAERLHSLGVLCNAEIPAAELRSVCALDSASLELLQAAMMRGTASARAFDRITRVARTIADLAGSERIARVHVAEALQYRSIERSARPAGALH